MPTDVIRFELECLKAHNKFRAHHGCPPLQLSRTLSARSREWAKNLAMRNTIENSSGHNFGENLYMAEGIHVDGARPVKAWYDEIEDYDFEAAQFVQGAGHFTQLIWKSTRELGVGVATNDKVTVVVTNYFTPGNIHGQFKENVPRRIDQVENIQSSFSEGSSSVVSNMFEGTLNVVLPKNFMSSTIISQGRESSIPVGMADTSSRISTISEVPISSAQLVLQISSDTLAGIDTRNSAARESRDLNRTMRNSITIKDIRYMPPPDIAAANQKRRTSSSGRVMLYRNDPNNVVGSNEPSPRQPVRRQESSKVIPPLKAPGFQTAKQEPSFSKDQSIVLSTTSTDEFDSHERPSILYKTFSNIVIKKQEQQSISQPFTTTSRSIVTRQDTIATKERGMAPSTATVKREPRSSSENDRNILYKTISNIVLVKPDETIPQTYKAPIRPSLTRQNSISAKRGDKSFVTAARTESVRLEQNGEIPTTTALRTSESAKKRPTLTKTNEADRQEQTNANDRKLLYKTTSTIFIEDQEPRSRQQFRRQDSISQNEQDISIEIERQKQNKEMTLATTSKTQTLTKEPGSSKVPDNVQKTPAHEAERQQRTSANVAAEKPSTRQQLRRQDSIPQNEQDISIKTGILRQEQNREVAPITTRVAETPRKEPGPSKSPVLLHKSNSAHEAEMQQRTSANDRKFLYRTFSDIVVGNQEPSTRPAFRRQDSISSKEQDMSHKAETTKQEQSKEMVPAKSLKAQSTSKEPGPTKIPDSVHRNTSAEEIQRQQQASKNDRKFLHRTASDIVVGTQGRSTLQPFRSQDFLYPKERDMALKTETAPRTKISQADPGSSRGPDIKQKSSPAHDTQRQQLTSSNGEKLRGSQEQTIQQQQSQTKTDLAKGIEAIRKEFARQVQNKEIPPKTTLSIQTAGLTCSNCNESKTSRKADVAHVMALRTKIANQELYREMATKKIPKVETGWQESKLPKVQDRPHNIPRTVLLKASKTEVDRSESKTSAGTGKPYDTSKVKTVRPEEATTSARSTQSKHQNPTTQTAPSAERPKNTHEFSDADKQFHHECLLAHNCYRAKHCSPPLQLCEQLSIYATKWAQELACIDQLLYSPTKDLGENIYMAAGIRINGDTPVKAWYNEVEDYDFEKAEFTPYTGHFTQVIWKDTCALGVGVIRNENCSIVVASYYPPGNEVGQFKENVLLPSPGCTFDTEQSNHSSSNNLNCAVNNSSDSASDSSKTSSGHGYLKAGILAAALAAAVGGWMIYNKPSP